MFLLIGFKSILAQNWVPYTQQEIELINQESNQMMRVTKLQNPQDSVILKSASLPINPSDPNTQILAKRMLLSVVDPENTGVGIAAPQVGINRRMIVVQRFDKENKPYEVFLNPEIIWASNLLTKGPEGDLSFDERGEVLRHYLIKIEYQTLENETYTEILEGFTAIIYQHERDHLDGTLLTDRVQEQKNSELKSIPEGVFYIQPN